METCGLPSFRVGFGIDLDGSTTWLCLVGLAAWLTRSPRPIGMYAAVHVTRHLLWVRLPGLVGYQPPRCVTAGLGRIGGTLCLILLWDLGGLWVLAVMATMRLTDNFITLAVRLNDELFIARG